MEPKIGTVIETPNRSNGYYFVVKAGIDLIYLLNREISSEIRETLVFGNLVQLKYVSEGSYGHYLAVPLDDWSYEN